MKKIFNQADLKDIPVNVLRSLPPSRLQQINANTPSLNTDHTIHSLFHQNAGKQVFEGFYKSITRKIG